MTASERGISPSGISIQSAENTLKSASLPGSILPRSGSWKAANAGLRVRIASASARVSRWSRPQSGPAKPSSVRRATAA